jgi:predicted permease
MSDLSGDLRYAVRGLRRSPLFAIVAVLCLGIGLGATTAIFTLLDQIVLRKLDVKQPERLVMLFQEGANNGSNAGYRMNSYPIYMDYMTKGAPLQEVLARRAVDASVSIDNQTERVDAELVSGNFFSMLGVKPVAGRVFSSEQDDRTVNGHPVVVISHDYWVNRFRSDPAVVGRKILVNNYPMTIVGVSAQGFHGLDPTYSPHIRVPILMQPAMMPSWTWLKMHDRRTRWVQVFARLKAGYTAETALPAMQVLFRQIREYEMTLPAAKDWSAYDRKQFMSGTIKLEEASSGYSGLRDQFSTSLWVLSAMVVLLLLIACANVANILIARGFSRQREIAVRLSIGASRGQLIRQLLIESLLLSLLGGLAGLAFSAFFTQTLLAFVPSEGRSMQINAAPDLRVLLFAFGATLTTGVVFGLLPALRASRPDPWKTLKDTVGSIAGAGGSLFLRKGLVAAQVGLSFLLLFGAGLFTRSLHNLRGTDTGFAEPDNLISFQIDPGLSGYTNPRGTDLMNTSLERIRALPGVTSAGVAMIPVLAGDEWDSTMSVEGHKAADGEDMQAFMNALSPGYFKAMRIRMIEGRDFTLADQNYAWGDGPAEDGPRVAIVNRRFAEHFFKGQSALGKRLGFGDGPKTKMIIEIVGVVENSLYEGPREGIRRQVFVPRLGSGGMTYYVRSSIGSSTIYGQLRNEIRRIDPNLPIFGMKTLESQLDERLQNDRLIALLSGAFGLAAALLASIGLYGVMAFVVARRNKELGIRLALGASRGGVLWLVMREVMILLATGLIAGGIVAVGLGALIDKYFGADLGLYNVGMRDPFIASGALLLLAAVAALAGLIPAQRASRINPIMTLRYE